jgi:hypothetical protein
MEPGENMGSVAVGIGADDPVITVTLELHVFHSGSIKEEGKLRTERLFT